MGVIVEVDMIVFEVLGVRSEYLQKTRGFAEDKGLKPLVLVWLMGIKAHIFAEFRDDCWDCFHLILMDF